MEGIPTVGRLREQGLCCTTGSSHAVRSILVRSRGNLHVFFHRLVDWEAPLSCHPHCHDVLWSRAPVKPSSYGLDTVGAMHDSWHGGLPPPGSLSGQQQFEERFSLKMPFFVSVKSKFIPV
jgi:hypothetical protein